jgi:AraC-like DNA-binding protein
LCADDDLGWGVKVIEYEFDSEDLPVPDQFGHAREVMSLLPAPYEVSSDHASGFRLRQHDLHLDSVRVWQMAMQPLILHRTARLIRQSDPETYNVVLLQRGTIGRTWSRHEATYGPRDIHFNDSSQPYELLVHDPHGVISCLGVEVPKKLLPLPRSRTDQLVARRLRGQDGIGALLGGFLTQLTTDTSSYLPSDGPRLSTVLVDLVSALFAHALDADASLPPQNHQHSLVLRIRGFIQEHLHDPRLNPDAVAAAHHISTSYLHRLFQRTGTTVAAWIRQQRLERASRDLLDPALATVPIAQVGARWGFLQPAAFSRAFRTAYGVAPKDYRYQAFAPTNHARPASS